MIYHVRNAFLLIPALLAIAIIYPASAATYRVVAYLTSQNQAPTGIVEGSPGFFYAQAGGTVILSVTAQGNVATLASFADPPYSVGSAPGATSANGLLYSSIDTTSEGNIFSVATTAGSEHTYPAQNFALVPLAGNLPSGRLFGIAYSFSAASYSLATVGISDNVTPFYQFPATERPSIPIYASDGNYYGVSQPSGSNAYFYRVTPSGSFTKLTTMPFLVTAFLGGGRVLQGSDGNFYGIQSTGLGCSGSNQHGAVYKLTPSGQFTILHDFGVCGNAVVNALIEGSDGKLYGATQANNVLFSLTKSGDYKVEFETTNGGTQGLCQCTLVQGSDGIIYGTALGGGPEGNGVIFALDVGLPIPKPHAREFEPRSGAISTRVRLWGYNLLNATVQFNRIPATQVVSSGPNYVWATVPTGASTGPITITTPGGASNTHGSFTVE